MKTIPTTDISPPLLTRAELAELLGGWGGYQLGTVGRLPVDPDHPEEVWLELRPCPDRRKRCSGCQQFVEAGHDTEEHWIRDPPLLGTPVQLLVHCCRLACPRCGPKFEYLVWLGRFQRVTRRLAESVARLARVLLLQHVADYFGPLEHG